VLFTEIGDSMAYTKDQLEETQERLAEIYGVSTRSERLKLAEDFGYGGTDASKLRSLRRISTANLDKRESANVSRYFKPYVTKDDPESWLGRVPPYNLSSDYTVQSYVMFVLVETDPENPSISRTIAREGNLNLGYEGLGKSRETTSVASTDIRQLFMDYDRLVRNKLSQSYAKAIAFTDEGAEQYIRDSGDDIQIPKKNRIFEISLISVFPTQAGKKTKTKTFQRGLPKGKQERITKRVNRAYGQFTREGGRLS
jgi:hypothetical protein